MHFADVLNVFSAITLVGALIFTALQVRQASQARRDQAAIAMLQTALSENSARVLDLMNTISEGAPASAIDDLPIDAKHSIIEFGLRLEVMGYMVFRGLVDMTTANDLAGGVILSYWARAKGWAEETRNVPATMSFSMVRIARQPNRTPPLVSALSARLSAVRRVEPLARSKAQSPRLTARANDLLVI